MSNIIIVKPSYAAASNGSETSGPNVTTPNPKEVWQVPNDGNQHYVTIDLGSVQVVDTFLMGSHSAGSATVTWAVQQLDGLNGNLVSTPVNVRPLYTSPYWPRSALYRGGAVTGRYFRFVVQVPTNQPVLTIGIASVGYAFQPQFNYEYGAGRPVIDTGTAERLLGGGFGINPGAILGGFQWTLGDLQPNELTFLYQLLRASGNTSPVWVVEDPDQTAGLNERTHYGLFTKIETYQRLDPSNTSIALQMEEWI